MSVNCAGLATLVRDRMIRVLFRHLGVARNVRPAYNAAASKAPLSRIGESFPDSMQAIIVATDQDERDILSYVLRHAGLSVAPGSDLKGVLDNWLERPADLVLVALDDGNELVRDVARLRAATEAPLLLIVDPVQEERLCTVLRAGADLVLFRPVSPRLLAEYCHVLLRRSGAVPTFVLPRLDLEQIVLDPAARTVAVAGKEARRLTQLEFRLLYVLMTNREQVIPTEVIVERVWGFAGEGDRDLVRGLVSRLRRKIEVDPENPRFVQNVPSVGYMFTLGSAPVR